MSQQPATLAALLAMPIYGNAHHDCNLLNALHFYIVDPANEMADRIAALDHLGNNVMGLGEPPATAQDVIDYVDGQ